MHWRGSRLRRWHIAIGVIMLLVSLTSFVLTFTHPNTAFVLPLTTDFGGSVQTVFLLPTTWLLAAATLVSATVHLFYVVDRERWHEYYTMLIKNKDDFNHRMARHINPVRWTLYAVFGSLLLWPLAQHAGVSNIFLLFGLTIANVYLQRAAYVLEMANFLAKKTENVNMIPFAVGGLGWLFAWATVVVYLFANPVVPSFLIWIAVLGAMVVSAAFGIVTLMRYYRMDNIWKHDKNIEKAYIVLEIILTVIIVAPILIRGLTL